MGQCSLASAAAVQSHSHPSWAFAYPAVQVGASALPETCRNIVNGQQSVFAFFDCRAGIGKDMPAQVTNVATVVDDEHVAIEARRCVGPRC